MKKLILSLILLSSPMVLFSQAEATAVKTIEGITNKMVEIISGPKGEERDWDEFRNLFLPRAQTISVIKSKDGRERLNVMNIEEFIRNIGPLYARDGFEEYSTGLTVNEFNGIAVAFQSFYCKNLIGTYENRGINSYHLIYAENRWWINSMSFANESEDSPIPEKYLFKDQGSKKE